MLSANALAIRVSNYLNVLFVLELVAKGGVFFLFNYSTLIFFSPQLMLMISTLKLIKKLYSCNKSHTTLRFHEYITRILSPTSILSSMMSLYVAFPIQYFPYRLVLSSYLSIICQSNTFHYFCLNITCLSLSLTVSCY